MGYERQCSFTLMSATVVQRTHLDEKCPPVVAAARGTDASGVGFGGANHPRENRRICKSEVAPAHAEVVHRLAREIAPVLKREFDGWRRAGYPARLQA